MGLSKRFQGGSVPAQISARAVCRVLRQLPSLDERKNEIYFAFRCIFQSWFIRNYYQIPLFYLGQQKLIIALRNFAAWIIRCRKFRRGIFIHRKFCYMEISTIEISPLKISPWEILPQGNLAAWKFPPREISDAADEAVLLPPEKLTSLWKVFWNVLPMIIS